MTVHLRGMQDKEFLLCQKARLFKNKFTSNYYSTVQCTRYTLKIILHITVTLIINHNISVIKITHIAHDFHGINK